MQALCSLLTGLQRNTQKHGHDDDLASVALPGHVECLDSPEDYYATLLRGIRSAENRIILSALYLGHEPLPLRLVQELVLALQERPQLKVTIIVDHSRAQRLTGLGVSPTPAAATGTHRPGSRGTQSQTQTQTHGEETPQRVMDVLLPALQAAPSRVKVLLLQIPPLQRVPLVPRTVVQTLLQKKPMLGELLGVYHAKFCVFDDLCLLTGANLSEEYFTQRQDRYLLVHGANQSQGQTLAQTQAQAQTQTQTSSAPLATFLQALVGCLEQHCHSLHADGHLDAPWVTPTPEVLQVTLAGFSAAHRTSQRDRSTSTGADVVSDSSRDEKQTDTEDAEEAGLGVVHTVAYPVLQLGAAGWNSEAHFLPRVMRTLAGPTLQATTGLRLHAAAVSSPYPSFTQMFSGALGALSVKLRGAGAGAGAGSGEDTKEQQPEPLVTSPLTLITPGPNAHGFSSASGMKALVPHMHESSLQRALRTAGCAPGADNHLYRYDRPGWTYHAKGLWCSLTSANSLNSSDNSTNCDGYGSKLPPGVELTYIGSSNLGARSVHRDLELGFVLVTRKDQLRKALQREKMQLVRHSSIQTKLPAMSHRARVLSNLLRTFL